MKNVKNTIANNMAKVALNMAKKACGAASIFGSCQPKEPKALKEMLNK